MCYSIVETKEGCHNASSPLVSGIQELLSRNWQVLLCHVYCKANIAADFLTNDVLSLSLDLHIFNAPPDGMEV